MLQIPEVKAQVSRPYTYTMTYLNGRITYTERFVLLTCSKEYVNSVGATLDAVLQSISAKVATIPYVGAPLAAIISLGAKWYGNASLNPDGSVTFQFAYHYCGTKAGGIDLTAWPLPGVDPNYWNGIINSLIKGISQSPSRAIEQDVEIDYAIEGNTSANAPFLNEESALDSYPTPVPLNPHEQALYNENITKAMQTLFYGKIALQTANARFQTGLSDGNGDAFRHAYWNALMTKHIDPVWAERWGTAHETGEPNQLAIRKEMDLANNQIGRQIGKQYSYASDEELANIVLQYVREGKLWRIVNNRLVPTDATL